MMRSRTKEWKDLGIPALFVLIALSSSFTIALLVYCHSVYSTSQLQSDRGHDGDGGQDSQDKVNTVTFSEENQTAEEREMFEYIRRHFLTAPGTNRSYSYLANRTGSLRDVYGGMVSKLLDRKLDGVFIDVGDKEGKTGSSVLYLEKRGWKGILIDCFPILLGKLRVAKIHKAWIDYVCAATNKPAQFTSPTAIAEPARAKLAKNEDTTATKVDTTDKQTGLVLDTVNFSFRKVYFFSLVVEGAAEYDILKYFPFNKMKFKVIIVKIHAYTDEQKNDLDLVLDVQGYYPKMKTEAYHFYVPKGQNSKIMYY